MTAIKLLHLPILLLAATAAAAAAATAENAQRTSAAGQAAGETPAAAGTSPRAMPRHVSLLVHLTDIHVSSMGGKHADRQRGPDLALLSSAHLSRWRPAAAVVTGDLTEAKDEAGRGGPRHEEWQEYGRVWRALLAEHGGGVPYNQVYDVRGNHDTFDSGSRCGPRDHYCTYSARAAAANASTAAAVPNDRLPGEGRRHEEMVAGGPVGRLFLDEVYDAPHGIGGGVQKEESAQLGDDLSGGGSGGEDREAASQQGGVGLQGREQEHQQDPHADGELGDGGGHGGGCPVAVLVGVDASLSPGMRSPLNFLGALRQSDLQQLDRMLADSVRHMQYRGCRPPYIAYGHYPLTTIAYPGQPATRAPVVRPAEHVGKLLGLEEQGAAELSGGQQQHPGQGQDGSDELEARTHRKSLESVLLKHGVSAYLSGHLHGLFGRRLHRLHAAVPAPLPASPAPGPGRPVGHLVDMESVDWKHQRAVRLITLDGTTLSYIDLQFVPPPAGPPLDPEKGASPASAAAAAGAAAAGVTHEGHFHSHDSTRGIGPYVVLITCPPDARHSPQLRPGYGSASGLEGEAVPVWDCGSKTLSGGSSGINTGTGLQGSAAVRSTEGHAGSTSSRCEPGEACLKGGGQDGLQGSAVVRVLVLPAAAAVPAVPPEVVLEWECVGAAEGSQQGGVGGSATGEGAAGRGARQLSGRLQMQLEYADEGRSTYTADLLLPTNATVNTSNDATTPALSPLLRCPPGLLHLRASVPTAPPPHTNPSSFSAASAAHHSSLLPSAPSTSELRPVHWPGPRQRTHGSQQRHTPSNTAHIATAQAAAAPAAPVQGMSTHSAPAHTAVTNTQAAWAPRPVPLGTTPLEWAVTHINCYTLGVVLFWSVWWVLVGGLLLLPRGLLLLQEGVQAARAPGRAGRGSVHTEPCCNGSAAAEAHGGGRRRAEDQGEGRGKDQGRFLKGTSTVAAGAGAGAGGPGQQGSSSAVSLGPGAAGVVKRANSGGGGNGANGGGGQAQAQAGAPGRGQEATGTNTHLSSRHQSPANAAAAPGAAAAVATGSLAAGGRLDAACRVALRLWPLCDFAVLARHTVPWVGLLAYLCYLAVGPWVAGQLVGLEMEAEAEVDRVGGGLHGAGSGNGIRVNGGGGGSVRQASYGVMTAHGVYLWQPCGPVRGGVGGGVPGCCGGGWGLGGVVARVLGGCWVRGPSQDYVVMASATACVCVLPACLVCASLVANWSRAVEDRTAAAGAAAASAAAGAAKGRWCGGASWVVAVVQFTVMSGVAFANGAMVWKLWAGLGWAGACVSPGVGWMVPLFGVWAWVARREVWGAGRRAGGVHMRSR